MNELNAWQLIIGVIALIVGSGGGAFAGVKVAINGLRDGQKELKKGQVAHDKRLDNHGNRLTRIETTLEHHL